MRSAGDEHDDDPADEPDRRSDDEHDDAPRGGPPHPLDRLWVHPAELPPVGASPSRRPGGRVPLVALVRPVLLGALGAVVAVAVLAALGAFDEGDDPPGAVPTDDRGDGDVVAPADTVPDEVARGVVLVTVRGPFGGAHASGVSVRHSGEILTSARALRDATSVTVTVSSGETFDATVVARDDTSDIALLTVPEPVPAVPVADAGLGIGDPIVVVGGRFPGERQTWRSAGVVARTNAVAVADPGPVFAGLYQTDNVATGGAAGGALLDGNGEVAGIVLAPLDGHEMSYALPIAVAISIAQELREHGAAAHGALELVGRDDAGGPIVDEVEPGGAADRPGVRPGDVIVTVAGRPVLGMGEVTAMVRRYGPGRVVAVGIRREGNALELDVELASTLPPA